MDWQSIATAPTDGTRLLLTDGTLFAAGNRAFRVEESWKFRGYVDGKITPAFGDRIPNPDAGKRHEWWSLDGCSAFREDAEIMSDDGQSTVMFEPTHWMPLPEPPERQD